MLRHFHIIRYFLSFKPFLCLRFKNPIFSIGLRRSFSTTNSLRIVEISVELANCYEALQTSCEMFTTLLSKHANLENIALQNGFEDISDLHQAIRIGQCNLANANEIGSEINKLEDLSIDAQQYKIKGDNAYQELKKSWYFNNTSYINKSQVLTALADSKHLHFKSEIKMLDAPIFTSCIK